jgi:phosphatidylglycerol:prolipoprotein diacylglycerol transferase
MFTISFPTIDPVIFQIYGPIALRWYNLAYIIGLGGGLLYCSLLVKKFPELHLSTKQLDHFFHWAILAVIIGGRLGEVVFYFHQSFFQDPWQILWVWDGGMSFHGAVIGLLIAFYFFSKRHNLSIFSLADCVTAAAPIGLFLGRIANFINDELYGRVTTVPWAVAFPSGGYLPRHPSQLYEAFLEGFVLFILLSVFIFRYQAFKKPGWISGLWLTGYGVSRVIVEFFREPDGLISLGQITLTTGQGLSLVMIAGGIYLLGRRQSTGVATE